MNMHCLGTRLQLGTQTITELPFTRAAYYTTIGIISSFGVVNVNMYERTEKCQEKAGFKGL